MAKCKKNGGSQSVPLFIEKLANILEDQSCQEYIQWTAQGDAFNIVDINRFTDIVLPKFFKHNNFSSFIRQLNMYGFSKVRHDQGDNVYVNENFKRDQKQLLGNIKRKINQTEKEDKVAIYNPQASNLGREVNELKNRQRNLESMCKQLIDQNHRLFEENNMMMKRLTAEQKQKNLKMEQLLVSLIMARGNNQLALPHSEQSRMLSLTNDAKPDYGVKTEGYMDFLEDNSSINRLKQALRKYQSEEKKRNKIKNYTIVVQPEHEASTPQPQYKQQSHALRQIKNQDDNEASVLSLGDFLNLEENSLNGPAETPI